MEWDALSGVTGIFSLIVGTIAVVYAHRQLRHGTTSSTGRPVNPMATFTWQVSAMAPVAIQPAVAWIILAGFQIPSPSFWGIVVLIPCMLLPLCCVGDDLLGLAGRGPRRSAREPPRPGRPSHTASRGCRTVLN